MSTFKFVVDATHEGFMESPLRDVSEHYVAADTFDEAYDYMMSNMKHGGWKVNSVKSNTVWVADIRKASANN